MGSQRLKIGGNRPLTGPYLQCWDLSLESSANSYLSFRLASLHSVFYFFFIYQSPFLSLCTVFYSVLSNIVEVLLINPSANVFVFENFNFPS